MTVRILQGDCRDVLRTLPDESVHCCVTSPPYWGLRDYGVDGQIGLEQSINEHMAALVEVFRACRRVLRDDGTLWVNYGDAYAGGGNGGGGSFAIDGIANAAHADKNIAGKRGAIRYPAGFKPKDRMLLPARLAIALCDDGWWLRDEIIWHKPNPMSSPGRGRTTPAHEMIYMLAKSSRYAFDQESYREPSAVQGWDDGSRVYGGVNKAGANAKHGERTTGRRTGKVKVPGGWDKGEGGHGTIHRGGRTAAEYVETEICDTRNKRSVWTVATKPFGEAHFATFPPDLIKPCILAGCPKGGTVLDPFGGAGTTGLVADRLGRNAILIELNPQYAEIARRRIASDGGLLTRVEIEVERATV
jgi:DNA modification methylase